RGLDNAKSSVRTRHWERRRFSQSWVPFPSYLLPRAQAKVFAPRPCLAVPFVSMLNRAANQRRAREQQTRLRECARINLISAQHFVAGGQWLRREFFPHTYGATSFS